jgi:hypothetical protein
MTAAKSETLKNVLDAFIYFNLPSNELVVLILSCEVLLQGDILTIADNPFLLSAECLKIKQGDGRKSRAFA